jgi:uncharacterized protein (TIGR03083 family)
VTSSDDLRLTGMLAAHRRQLTELLATLPQEDWDRPTLCAGWRVREVVAHILMPLRYPTWRFLAEMARTGGNFDRMADRVARRDGAVPPPDLVTALRQQEYTVWKPPGGGAAAGLTHDVIHGQDIAVALGVEHLIPEEAVRIVLDTVAGPKSRKHFLVDLEQIQLSAVDIDWSFGSGRVLSGSATDLALVLCGRTLPASRLRGGSSTRFTTVHGSATPARDRARQVHPRPIGPASPTG